MIKTDDKRFFIPPSRRIYDMKFNLHKVFNNHSDLKVYSCIIDNNTREFLIGLEKIKYRSNNTRDEIFISNVLKLLKHANHGYYTIPPRITTYKQILDEIYSD